MGEIQSCILDILSQLSSFLWGIPMVVLLFGTHLFLTFKTRGIQRYLGKAIKMTLKGSAAGGDISNFSALMVAMAATVGTGNIVGGGNRYCVRWPRCCILVLANGCFWCGYQVCRSVVVGKIPL